VRPSADGQPALRQRGDTWENEVTLRSVENMLAFEPGGWAPFVSPTPLLMIVAARDSVTFPGPQQEIFESAHEPKRLVVHDGGHFDTYTDHFEETSTAARDWLQEHLSRPDVGEVPVP
jgi:fermentation-respiration switch protein FrsA (DUF1100 family)